ncbi:hypothetical protein E1212_03785 [Jiangella ureilytica]|uniref:Uncharacterized protein n=1 Tax=Jiangella ureilytica TaxID=2530374 RepID=A0A4V2XXM8_9ACTN|nr:hypothetical protein [Jiangella ureilytica]TDC53925.1 hypothetical protein E1212_03785 [Jiangella ureilytica]
MTGGRHRCDSQFARGTARTRKARPISTPQHTDGHPWCAEHDPTGTCLGHLHVLPRDGAAWLEGGPDDTGAVVVVALARPGARTLPAFTAAEARELAAALTALANELDAGRTPV